MTRVVASAAGGIVDQITTGEHGLLIDDPDDLVGFGAAIEKLPQDPGQAARLGHNARRRAVIEFLGESPPRTVGRRAGSTRHQDVASPALKLRRSRQ